MCVKVNDIRDLHLSKFRSPARPGLKILHQLPARTGPDSKFCITCRPGPARGYNMKTQARPGPGTYVFNCYEMIRNVRNEWFRPLFHEFSWKCRTERPKRTVSAFFSWIFLASQYKCNHNSGQIIISARIKKKSGFTSWTRTRPGFFFNKNLPARARPGCFQDKICRPGPGPEPGSGPGFRTGPGPLQTSNLGGKYMYS